MIQRVLVLPLMVLALSTATAPALSQNKDTYPVTELARIMGELHYLSYRCRGEEAQHWRREMLNLLELEAPTRGPVRTRLIDAFNAGYGLHDRNRTRCGAQGEMLERQLASEGQVLARQLTHTYID